MVVILSHLGIYNELNKDYKDYALYKKCYESVLREFKNDEIFVYHSLNELFNKFPGLEEEYNKYSSFIEEVNYNPAHINDLITLLLSRFTEDYLCLEADIYIYKGFREYLMSYIKNYNYNLIMTDYFSTCICYCKSHFESLDFFIDRAFNDGNYSYNNEMNKKYGLNKLKEVYCIPFDEFSSHFHSLQIMRDFVKKIIFLTNSKYNNYNILVDLIKSFSLDIALATPNYLVFKDTQGIIKLHQFLDKEVGVNDVLLTCKKLGGRIQFQKIESFDLGGLN